MVPPILPEAPSPSDPSAGEIPRAAAAASAELHAQVLAAIDAREFLPFSDFMAMALYTPGLGYYAGGSHKLGATGDFITAPEISTLFGQALAAQVAPLLDQSGGTLLELGAGSGRLAADVLQVLAREDRLPDAYLILEVSAELRERQQTTLRRAVPHLVERVRWLDRLPAQLAGVVLGNEVLDAIPAELVTTRGGEILQCGLVRAPASDGFAWATRPAQGELLALARNLDLPDGYTTEIHLQACGLVRSLGHMLTRGAAIFIDYGFPRREYYHPERDSGTLMCHHRQRAHPDPLRLIGLQDISVHVDFTALAEAALDGGLELCGYTGQAQFLINCGILDLLGAIDPADAARYAPACAAVQRLLSPAEMGELFKVIAFGRGIARPLRGFRTGDRLGTL